MANKIYLDKFVNNKHIEIVEISDNNLEQFKKELIKILQSDENTVIESDYEPFEKLSIFFLNLETTPYTLTFEDIEKIMGIELCSSAYKYSSYWHKERSGRISECWKNNGYIIHSLHMNTKKVIFRKEDTTILKLQIPPLFLTQKIPGCKV